MFMVSVPVFQIVRFAISKNVVMADQLTNKSIDNARRNIRWVHENKNELKKFLSDFTLKKKFDKFKNKFKFK